MSAPPYPDPNAWICTKCQFPNAPPGQPGYPPAGQPGDPPPVQPGYPPPGQYPPPVTQQPGGYQPPPQAAPGQYEAVNCPPGLQYLTQVDQLLIKQKADLAKAFYGCESENEYKIKNSAGQEIYKAKEDTDCCTRQCYGPSRAFDMEITDNAGNEVMHLYRPQRCESCFFPCCMQMIEVSSPPGTVIGTVEQEW